LRRASRGRRLATFVSLLARALAFGALILALVGLPSIAGAKTILFIAPHPDDEALVSAGRIREAVVAGDTVKIVVVTNGDFGGVEQGLQRQGESVAAAELLGVTEQDVIFLGYPDAALMDIYSAPSPTAIITSHAGRTSTYGNRGLGGMDFHSYKFGSPGSYNRVTVEQDLRTLLATYLPDEIYTVSHFDVHRDHHATALFVTDALVAFKRSGAALSTKLYQGIVWPPSQDNWPDVGACSPSAPFPPPQMQTQLEWKRTLRAVVLANLKCQAIFAYASAVTPRLLSFARKDEFFWMSDFGANLAITAEVTASSENSAASQGRLKAVDGVADGAWRDPTREWVSSNQLSGAWIQLAWPEPVSVAQVNLHDRPLAEENILAGTLLFSDGSSIAVGALPSDGKVLPVTFAPKTVTWMRFIVDQAQGTAAGLSEIQVLGLAAQSAGNVAPHFLEGPAGNTDIAILSAQSASLSVLAHDLNGDAVQYHWSADGGSINASGPTALFTAPAVTESTVFTISAEILDGRGGSARSVGFVTVTASADALSVSPAAVLAGDAAQGTITLARAAPAGGLSVPLSSSNPAAASVPASVTVPAGAFSTSFPVSTAPVGAKTTVTLSANVNGTSRTATLEVSPRPGAAPPQNLLLSPDSIGGANWQVIGALGATLNYAAAPDGTQQASRIVSTQAGGHALRQLVEVAENTQYTFSFWARNNGGAAAANSVHCLSTGTDIVPSTPYLSAINGSSWTQVSTTFTTPAGCTSIFVYPLRDSGSPVDILLWRATLVPASAAQPGVSSLTVSPASVTGGSPAAATVTLSGPAPAGGAQVALSTSSAAAAVPASVSVSPGATSASFAVSTSAVATSTPVTLSASYGGATQTASLTVMPPSVSSLIVSPASVAGGSPATGTVMLNGPAPAGGAQVALSSSNPAVAVPASVTVSPGGTSATFSLTTSPVAASTPATISASYGGATLTTSLTVMPPSVSSLSLTPTTLTGGSAATGTVTLDGPAPAGGAQVTLSSSNAAVTVPAGVTVAAGATSASFNLGTSAVAGSTTVTISASSGGATRSASITVLPAVLSSMGLDPTSVIGGPLGYSTGTVRLNGPAPAGGAQIALASSKPGAASVPSSVTVPAGATQATFTVSTSLVVTSTTVTISASYSGTARNANLQVNSALAPVL
jgi:LmbE family N-acetylglucosaminyl deacetylase